MSLRDVVESPFTEGLPDQRDSTGRRGAGLPGMRGRTGQRPKTVRAAQFFFLDMTVPFTSVSGEQKQAATLQKQFPLSIRAAWSDLVQARANFISQASGIPVATQQVPLLSLAGNTNLAHPLLYWQRPLFLPPGTSLIGNFTNDGAEAAGQVVFFCERPDMEKQIVVGDDVREYVLLLDLGLSGGATQTGRVSTQQIEYDLLIYGALSTSASMKVKFTDTSTNQGWSAERLPIGAFAGIRATGNVQPIVYYSKPYFLPRNASIEADWLNVGSESGKYVAFICERLVNDQDRLKAGDDRKNPRVTVIDTRSAPRGGYGPGNTGINNLALEQWIERSYAMGYSADQIVASAKPEDRNYVAQYIAMRG